MLYKISNFTFGLIFKIVSLLYNSYFNINEMKKQKVKNPSEKGLRDMGKHVYLRWLLMASSSELNENKLVIKPC